MYVNEDSGVVEITTGSNWKVESSFSVLSLWDRIPNSATAYACTHAHISLCLQLWGVSVVLLITSLQTD